MFHHLDNFKDNEYTRKIPEWNFFQNTLYQKLKKLRKLCDRVLWFHKKHALAETGIFYISFSLSFKSALIETLCTHPIGYWNKQNNKTKKFLKIIVVHQMHYSNFLRPWKNSPYSFRQTIKCCFDAEWCKWWKFDAISSFAIPIYYSKFTTVYKATWNGIHTSWTPNVPHMWETM